MNTLQKLKDIRSHRHKVETVGIADSYIQQFLKEDPRLPLLIDEAWEVYQYWQTQYPDLMSRDEVDLIRYLQQDYVNFYEATNINPYVALAAKGPWTISSYGAVIYDTGGYGMLGFGQNHPGFIKALAKPQAMANIMTPHFNQWRFAQVLKKEIGHRRSDKQKYARYLCVNSGSEAVTVACRIVDCNAKLMTDPGANHAGKRIMFLGFKGGFHGRTDPPAQFSDSSLKNYKESLASFRDRQNLVTVEPNNINELRKIFAWAEQEGVYLQAMICEPVMGEGDPGKAMTPQFYKEARALTLKHGSLLVIDSIQAGLRTNACLSVVDYPGFENLEYPDMETFSKALNGGQYPFSLLAMNEKSSHLYKTGIYGNTMTTNPRALELGIQVLEAMTPALRKNIQRQGQRFVEKLKVVAEQFPKLVTGVQGTGLLFSVSLDKQRCPVVGEGGIEKYLRCQGLGVIHGGQNALRFTPVFDVSDSELDLVVALVESALRKYA